MTTVEPSSPSAPEVSVVIPTYNEEDNVVQITEAVIQELTPITRSFEIVIIDNNSADRTVELIRELCVRYPFVRSIVNTRNFGQMRSPTHAIYSCRGEAIIGLCADFQDPPSLLPQFIGHWRAGAKIVLGVTHAAESGWILGLARKLSYGLLARIGEVKTIAGATGFGLYDSEVVATLKRWNDPEPFFRAMLVESGFVITTIPFMRPMRERGLSKNSWRTLSAFALSALPLLSRNTFRIAFISSLAIVCAGAFVSLLALPAIIFSGAAAVLGLIGIALIVMGGLVALISMLGIQVMAVSDRVRNVPLVIERERMNFDDL